MMKRIRAGIIAWASTVGCSSAGPTTLATGEPQPLGIAAQGGNVYWVNHWGGTVRKIAAGGGTPATLASGQATPTSIAVDGANVYWTNDSTQNSTAFADIYNADGAVMTVPLAGGTPTTLASGQYSPLSIAVDATSVYFVSQGSNLRNGSVMKVPIGGGAPTTLASGQFLVGALAVDATSVYWTNGGATGSDGHLMKVPIAGGAATTLATGWSAVTPGRAWGTIATPIAVDATSVYWMAGGANPGGGSLMKVAKDGGTTITLASFWDNPGRAIVLDATNVYFSLGRDFLKVPIGGGLTIPFAVGVSSDHDIGGFALDATNVYWTDLYMGKVMSTPKTP
jgi:hypothetical protein